jgi:hypothetical protein
MKHKLSNWKIALPVIALACLVVLPQAIQAQEDTLVYLPLIMGGQATADGYTVVDTGQNKCYNNNTEIACSQEGQAFYGQDAQYTGVQPDYVDNGDGTVMDLNAGLMWQKTPGDKVTYAEAVTGADSFNLAGYDDWRLPTIKELYSLIDFSGTDVSGWNGIENAVPFIDTNYFDFEYGDPSAGERYIDAQYWSSTEYVGTTMNGEATVFGVNFADGRIKGYGLRPDGSMTEFVRYVRGNTGYGVNDFVDNGDGTITDNATGLMWSKSDSGGGMNWEDALAWVQQKNEENYLGYNDWRLPNAKELQSIIDYTRSPATTSSAAIAPIFSVTPIIDEGDGTNYPFYWTGTTHSGGENLGGFAIYIAFGEALGFMEMPPNSGNYQLLDVHGAGAQRSDPKTGNPDDYPYGHGPQGDVIRIYNYVRCVRGGAEFIEMADSGTGGLAGQSPTGNQPPGGQPPAGNQPLGGQSPMGGTPPQEAIGACSGLSENATCAVTTPRGTLSGTCMPVQSQLACVPQGGPPAGAP